MSHDVAPGEELLLRADGNFELLVVQLALRNGVLETLVEDGIAIVLDGVRLPLGLLGPLREQVQFHVRIGHVGRVF